MNTMPTISVEDEWWRAVWGGLRDAFAVHGRQVGIGAVWPVAVNAAAVTV